MKILNLTHVTITTAEEVITLPLISRFVAKHGDTLVSVTRFDGVVVEVLVEGPVAATVAYVVDADGVLDLTHIETRFPDMDMTYNAVVKSYAISRSIDTVVLRVTKVNFLGNKEVIKCSITYGKVLPVFSIV